MAKKARKSSEKTNKRAWYSALFLPFMSISPILPGKSGSPLDDELEELKKLRESNVPDFSNENDYSTDFSFDDDNEKDNKKRRW